MNAETRPEPSPLKSLTASDDPLGVGALPDAAEEEKDDDGGEANVAELQGVRDLRLEREKMIAGGRGRPSARVLRVRAERARERIAYLSPIADVSMMPPTYTPSTIVVHGISTPATKNAELPTTLQGDGELGAVLNQLNSKTVTGVPAPTITQFTEKRKHEGHAE